MKHLPFALIVLALLLSGCGGSSTSTAPAPAPQAPTASLTVSPTTISTGEATTLTWSTTSATTVSIAGIGSVASSGSQSVAPSNTTTYTLTATGTGGTAQANATAAVLAPLFSDSFDRPDQQGLGETPQGQTWMITGAGYLSVAIQDHHYVDGPSGAANVSYAGIQLSQQPVRIGGMISFLPSGTSGTGASVVALISSSDNGIQLQNMAHLIAGRTGIMLTWWQGGTSTDNLPASCTGNWEFSSPLLEDGTTYPLYMNISGSTITVDKPDGTQYVCTDPHFAQVTGTLGIWELAYDQTQEDMPRWDKAEAFSATE